MDADTEGWAAAAVVGVVGASVVLVLVLVLVLLLVVSSGIVSSVVTEAACDFGEPSADEQAASVKARPTANL